MLSSNALNFLHMICTTSKNLGPHVSIISFDKFEYSLATLVHFELLGWKLEFDYFNKLVKDSIELYLARKQLVSLRVDNFSIILFFNQESVGWK
jgi:hypothetical protein